MEEGLSTTRISYEAGKRHKKAKCSDSANYYCVPNWKRTQYKVNNKAKIKTDIGFFHFQKPQKEERNDFNLDFGEEEGKVNSM